MLGFLLASLLGGCADYTMVGIKQREANILVHPAHIDFGSLESGFESEQRYFTVTNTGDDDLTIAVPTLVSGNDRFSILDNIEEDLVIKSGELIQFDVMYTPETYEANGAYIEIASDDIDEGIVQVTLEGYGDAPVMTVAPDFFDYGLISIGCDNEERVTITNDGNMPLVIDSVTQMVTQPQDILMEFGTLPDPPWTIDQGLSLDFLVSYIPNDTGYDESNIRIAGNDPALPEVDIIQYGDGDVEQWYTETYVQAEIPVLDVLWVVDDSGSMNQFQTNLSTNIGLFVTTFMASGADYHMAVITTGDSRASAVITSSDPDPEYTLSTYVMVGIGGNAMEKGIAMSRDALSSSTSAGPGSAFFRDDATLIVIYVSDEPDHSEFGWASYLPFFDALKPAGQFIPYGVIGDYPGGCVASPFGSATAGAGYWELIDHYGGEWYSICASDWGVQLQNFADAMTARRAYDLNEEDPIEDTIVVTVNGQLTTDWEYDTDRNRVVFAEGSIPAEGQTIEISYAVWGCDGE